MDATFSAVTTTIDVTLRDLSVIGAQIEHSQPLRPAMQGRLIIGEFEAPASVVWTRLAGPGQYRSGLRIEAPLEVVAAAIRDLLARGVVRKGEDTIRQREEARIDRQKSRMRLTGMDARSVSGPSAVDAHRIRDARKWLLAHPDEAMKWYHRVRATATEDHLRIAGSGRTNREDVLAVWECLERGVDLHDVVLALE